MIPPPRSQPPARAVQRIRSHAGMAALIVSITLMLAGCSRTEIPPEPETTATDAVVTSVPSPAPGPTRSPQPERPAAMDDVSVEGAIAAATYFISLYPYVYNTGDLTEWNALSHPECVFCASVVDAVEEMQAKSEVQVGTETSVVSAEAVEIDPAWFSVDLTLVQEPWAVVDAAGVTVREGIKAHSYRMAFVVVRDESKWLVRAAEYEAIDGSTDG